MNCRHAENLIQTSLDGYLTPSERAVLDLHVAACPACQRIWDEYRQVARLADSWTRAASDVGDGEAWTQAVLARLPASRPALVPTGWPAWTVASLAALLLIAVVFFWPGVAVAPSPSAFLPAPSDALTLPGWLARTFGGLSWAALPAAPSLPLSPLGMGIVLAAALFVNIVCFGRAKTASRRAVR